MPAGRLNDTVSTTKATQPFNNINNSKDRNNNKDNNHQDNNNIIININKDNNNNNETDDNDNNDNDSIEDRGQREDSEDSTLNKPKKRRFTEALEQACRLGWVPSRLWRPAGLELGART